jgi:hypothetical protein
MQLKGGNLSFIAGVFPRNGRKGQALVELAIALPLLVLIMIGVLDLGRAFFGVITITNAAREGARIAMSFPEDHDLIRDSVRFETQNSGFNGLIDPALLGIISSCPSGCDSKLPVRVEVSYEFNLILLPNIIISRSAEMMVP